MADMTLAEAIAEVKPHSNWNGAHFLPTLFRAEIRDAIATILNAVLSGDLIPRADAELAVAEAIRRAAEAIDGANGHDEAAQRRCQEAIIALASADALAEVQRLREERDDLRAAVEGLIAVLDRNDKKGPIPDVEMMFCWLAAQNVRAAFRKIAPKGEAT